MNQYTFKITNHTGNGYTKTISAQTLPTAIRKAMNGMLAPRHRKDAYIEHIDQRINPFSQPLVWNVIQSGQTFGTIELLAA
jgi:hypothetical protein